MAQQIDFEGQIHEFPDTFSQEDIGRALKSLNPAPISSTVAPALVQGMVGVKEQWEGNITTLAAEEDKKIPFGQRLVSKMVEGDLTNVVDIGQRLMPLGLLNTAAKTISSELVGTSPEEVELAKQQLAKNRGVYAAAQEDIDAAIGTPSDGILPTGRELGVGVVTNLARNTPGLAAGILLKANPAAAIAPSLALGSAQAATDASYGVLDNGKSYESAVTAGGISGVAEGALEIIPMGTLFKNLGKAKVMKLVTDYVLKEIPSEMATSAIQDVTQQVYAHPEKPLGEFLHDFMKSQVQTVLTTAISAPIQGGAVGGIDALSGRRNNDTSPEQTPPPASPPPTTQTPPVSNAVDEALKDMEREETDTGIGLDPAGVDEALANAQGDIDYITRRLEEGASVDDFIVDIDNALDATTGDLAGKQAMEAAKQVSVFPNPLVRGLDNVGLVEPDQAQSNDVIDNRSNWVDPNDSIARTDRLITRVMGLPDETAIGTKWGDFDASQFDNIEGPVVLQVGMDSETRPSDALAAVVQDVYDNAKLYNPKGRYVILPETMGRGKQGTYFYHNGVHYITPRHIGLTVGKDGAQRTIEQHNWNARQEFISSMYHEFEHSLVMERVLEDVVSRPAAIRIAAELQAGQVSEASLKEVHPIVAKLMRDWMDARGKILRGEMGLEEAAAKWFSPTKMINRQTLNDRLKDIRRKSLRKPYTAKELFDAFGGAENWLTFSEYLAEQMPKYMNWSGKWGKSATAQTLKVDTINAATIGRFFKDVIEKMEALFKSKIATVWAGPNRNFIDWMEHLASSTQAFEANLDQQSEEIPAIDWGDDSNVNALKTALTGLLRDKLTDMQEYKEQMAEIKQGNFEVVLDFVEKTMGGKLQFDRIGGRDQYSLNVPPLNDFAFTTLETMNPAEYVTAKELKAAAKKASAKPSELSLLLKALDDATRLPVQDFINRLSRYVRPLQVVRNERYGTIGMAQVGLWNALGSTWEVRGEKDLNRQPHIMDRKTLAFFRTFEADDATYVADIQSDVFQKWDEMQKDEDDAEALENIAWMKDTWVPTVVQLAVKQAVRRGAAVVRFATGKTMQKIQGWSDEEANGQYRPVVQRYDGTIAKYIQHRYGATLSPDGQWWEFSTLQESVSAPIVPFGESGRAAPNNTLPSNGTLMFDRTTDEGKTFNQALRRLLKLAPQNAGTMKKSWFKTYNYHMRFLQLEQMAYLHPELEPLQDAAKDEAKFNEVKSFLVRKASEVVDSLSMMTTADHKFFFDLTRAEFRSGVHLTDLVQMNGEWTHVPTERLAEAFKKAGYPPGEARTDTRAKLYIEAKNAIQMQMNRLEKVLLAKRFKKFSDAREDMRHRAMAEVIVAFKRLREQPFWPQQRYGKFQVIVQKKGEDGSLVKLYHGAFDTVEEQQSEFNRLKTKYKTGVRMMQTELSENAAIVQMLPATFIDDAVEMLGLSAEDEAALRALADRGEANLSKVYDFGDKFADGGSTDFFRNFADFTLHTGNLVAKMEFRSYFDRHIRAIKALERKAGLQQTQASLKQRKMLLRLADELEYHKMQLFSPDTEFYTIRSLVSLSHLAFAPITALLNVMSLFQTHLWITAQTNPAVAAEVLAKSLWMGTKFALSDTWAQTAEEKQLHEIIEMGYSRGVIDQAYSYVLAGQASTSILHRLASKSLAGKGFRFAVDTVGMYPFKKTEELVRVITMLSVAQTLQKSGRYSGIIGTQELFDETSKMSRLLVGNYNSNSRPSILAGYGRAADGQLIQMGKWTSLATIFMTYSQLMAFHAYGGIEVGQRRQADVNGESLASYKSYTAYTALLLLAIGGVEGFPGMESIVDILEAVAKKMGWTSDLRKDMREFIAAQTGLDPNLAMRGFGHDVFGFDLSNKLGLGRMVPGTDRIVNPQADTAAEYYGALGLSLFGVFGGTMQSLFKMASAYSATSGAGLDWTTRAARIGQEAPGSIGNAFDAYEWSRIGARGPRGGVLLMDEEGRPRTATAGEVILRSQGVSPTEVNVAKEQSWTRRSVVNYWTSRRKGIVDAYVYVHEQYPDEPEKKKGVIEAMHLLNRDLAGQGDNYLKAFKLNEGMMKQAVGLSKKAAIMEEKGKLPKRDRLVNQSLGDAFEDEPPLP
jgi:hypothetical protein